MAGSAIKAVRSLKDDAHGRVLELKERVSIHASESLQDVVTAETQFIQIVVATLENAWVKVLRPKPGYVQRDHLDGSSTVVDGTLYARALERSGGAAAVKSNAELSNAITDKVSMARIYRGDKGADAQHPQFQFLGMDALYEEAKAVMPRFEACVAKIADVSGGEAKVAPIKERERAEFKCSIKYGSDCTRLIDILRATILFPTVEALYKGLAALDSQGWFDGEQVVFELCSFEDRLQEARRLTGGYGDVQLTVSVDGHVCELQLNIRAMAEAKQAGGHSTYREEREENELLLLAAIRGRVEDGERPGIRSLLANGADANAVKDKNGHSALHYAAFSGDTTMAEVLLKHGANPLALSRLEQVPAHAAVMKMRFAVARVLLDAMCTPDNLAKIGTRWCEPKAIALRLCMWAEKTGADWPPSSDAMAVGERLKELRAYVEDEGSLLQSVPEKLRGVQFTSRSLNLSGLLSDRELRYVNIQLKYHSFIEKLDASSCTAGPDALRGLSAATNLRTLDLSFGLSSVECLEALTDAVASMTDLEEIAINNNYELRGKGAAHAIQKFGAALRKPQRFLRLSVGGHNGSLDVDEGIEALMAGLGAHPTLRSLSVFNNTDYSAQAFKTFGEALSNMPSLTSVNLGAAALSEKRQALAFGPAIRGSTSLCEILIDDQECGHVLVKCLNQTGKQGSDRWQLEYDSDEDEGRVFRKNE